jgi:hypothetical protein
LLRKIEKLRSTLQDLAQQYGINDPIVIRKSQMLDKLIVQYMLSLPLQKSKLQIDMSTEELHRRLESLNRLREEIEVLEQSRSPSDLLVMKKACQLSRRLMEFIHR